MWFDPVLYVMVVPMLAAHVSMGISIRNPLFSSDRLCMTTIYSFTLRGRRLCLFASAALTWLMLLCNGACLISAVVGIAILVPCCLGRITAAHFVFGHLWISFTGVRSLGCGDLSFIKRGPERWPLTRPVAICNRCQFPKKSMWMPGNIISQTQHVGQGRLLG